MPSSTLCLPRRPCKERGDPIVPPSTLQLHKNYESFPLCLFGSSFRGARKPRRLGGKRNTARSLSDGSHGPVRTWSSIWAGSPKTRLLDFQRHLLKTGRAMEPDREENSPPSRPPSGPYLWDPREGEQRKQLLHHGPPDALGSLRKITWYKLEWPMGGYTVESQHVLAIKSQANVV